MTTMIVVYIRLTQKFIFILNSDQRNINISNYVQRLIKVISDIILIFNLLAFSTKASRKIRQTLELNIQNYRPTRGSYNILNVLL